MTTLVQRFSVGFEFPIVFTRGLFEEGNPVFWEAVSRLEPERRHQVLFVLDENVAAAQPDLATRIRRYCERHAQVLRCVAEPVLVPGGEGAKNDLDLVLRIVELVNRHGIDRQSFICAVGGGAVLDMVCFAAAIAHRSVRVVRVPTTVLAQNDSGVGVKSGINLFGKKNFIGAFMPPFAVLNDADFLATLSHRDLIAGIAEAVKVSLIRDREFFLFLESNAARLARAEPEVMTEQIRRSAELHTRHIGGSGDPFEFGSARPLDFGHWAAHKMESLTHNRLRHGEAVALGMALDTLYSVKKGFLAQEHGERVLSLLETLGFTLWEPELDHRTPAGDLAVLVGLREFR
ncbi:MAG TPA: 3-dehydroquinate synthase, partial [bacterium]|nr:3-dehydroquinate synthase [bacterium]